MKILLALILFLLSFTLQAQVTREWVSKYNGPANIDAGSNSIAVDSLGNVYVTGFSEGYTGTIGSSVFDYSTVKYNSAGVEQWSAIYNGPAESDDEPSALAIDNKGNVYVTGFSIGIGTDLDYATVKYNSAGVKQWVARYNGAAGRQDFANAIAVDKEGNICVTGGSWGGSSGYDFVTIKYNPDGVQIWLQIFDGSGHSTPQAMTLDAAGNVYVTGQSVTDFATVKYSAEGAEQWVKKYNGAGNSIDNANALAVDYSGNLYVTGGTTRIDGGGACTTIKYDATGAEVWVKNYNGPGNTSAGASAITIDHSGNVIVTGSTGSGLNTDYATIKYSSAGIQQWASAFNGSGNSKDFATSVKTDSLGNVYVSGSSTNAGILPEFATIKYNSDGVEKWIERYEGPPIFGVPIISSMAIDKLLNIYITGVTSGGSGILGSDFATIKYSQQLQLKVTRPIAGSKFIAGESDTIKWDVGQAGPMLQIDYSVDNGNSYSTISTEVASGAGFLVWKVPDNILTTKAKIRIIDRSDPSLFCKSDTFRNKPYLLTRLNADSTYYGFRKDRDQWGFSNTQDEMWPQSWYSQFNYQGIDPFSSTIYPQSTPGFSTENATFHPDWISWVNAFSVKACYLNTNPYIYSWNALLRWKAANPAWFGSCFGISAANALVFSHKEQFQSGFPNFPLVMPPVAVTSDDGVKRLISELFTHQFGNPSKANDITGKLKKPFQTIQELKQMLIEDNASVKTLTIFNNSGLGAHTLLAYGLKQDSAQAGLYYVKVYCTNPNSVAPITVDLTANHGNGSWYSPDWVNWSGDNLIYLEVVSDNYLTNATKSSSANYKSPFILPDDRIEINNKSNSDIIITNIQSQSLGLLNKKVISEIPDARPLMIKNGSETPPYGYSLPLITTSYQTEGYHILLNNFKSDTVNTYFFTGNKSFFYERNGATQSQSDNLYFDGTLDVGSYDEGIKTFSVLNLVNETTQEKLCVLSSLKIGSNESLRVSNPDSNTIKITTFYAAKNYDLELKYATSNGIGKFECKNITLPGNSSHTIAPDWEHLSDSSLMVFVDLNQDETIDDTLFLKNQLITGFDDQQGLLNTSKGFYLSQNSPNPFSAATSISYQLP